MVTTAPLAAGHELDDGRYRVIRHIGGGGQGTVYLVTDTGVTANRWAVKEMRTWHLPPHEQADAVRRFQAEATLLASLKHRNLPNVVRYFAENQREYLVMEFIEGETLEHILQRHQGPLPEAQVLEWAGQVCDVLTYVHEHSPPIIFRDLSPDNVMLQVNGTITLIDFGIARHFDPSKQHDTLQMGKIGYAPPEQYGGAAQTTPRSDIYALAATLHVLLTARDPSVRPFFFPLAHDLNPAVSPIVGNVLAQALNYDAEARFASVTDFRRALLGSGQLRFCPHCGMANRGTSMFCVQCGGRLATTTAPPADHHPPSQAPGGEPASAPHPSDGPNHQHGAARTQDAIVRRKRAPAGRLAGMMLSGVAGGMFLAVLPALVTPGVSVSMLSGPLQTLTFVAMILFGSMGVAVALWWGLRR